MPWGLIIPGAIVIIIILYLVRTYNKLVSFSVRVDNGWSQVEVQLKKRFDLVPNLVETVKGYAVHEKSTLEEVVKCRNMVAASKTADDQIAANNALSKAITNLLVTVERYPELKANTNFLDLQQQLQEIESKIAFSRQFYNDTVMKYNEFIQMFPSNIVASMAHYTPRGYFEAEEEAHTAPKVQF